MVQPPLSDLFSGNSPIMLAKVWANRTQKESPHFSGWVQVEYQCLKGRATSRRQFTFLATSVSNICKHQPLTQVGMCQWYRSDHLFGSCLLQHQSSLDSFNKYGFYVAIAIGPETVEDQLHCLTDQLQVGEKGLWWSQFQQKK